MSNRKKLQPGLKLALGFMLLIAIGALLLYLPISHQDGVDVKFIDALFVSTSAICVTGLTPVDISQTLSVFGSTVLMLLIQIGGLGYAVVAVLIIRLASGRIDAFSGNLLRDSWGADHRVGTKRILTVALSITGIFEFIGAISLFTVFSPHYPLGRAIYLSVFHSVSAFNNAGFDLFSDSMMKWNDNPVALITIALLIALGGLGFILYNDIIEHVRNKKKITVHTKIVLSTTIFLIAAGTVLFRIVLPGIDWKNAFFQSVTTRTAGYFSYDQTSFANLYPLPASEVREIIRMNRNGQKPESLKGEPVQNVPEFISAVGDDSITRFDETRKKRKNRNRNNRQQRNSGEVQGTGRNGRNETGADNRKSRNSADRSGQQGDRQGQQNRNNGGTGAAGQKSRNMSGQPAGNGQKEGGRNDQQNADRNRQNRNGAGGGQPYQNRRQDRQNDRPGQTSEVQ